MKKRVASIQFSVKLGDLIFNQRRIKELVAKAHEQFQPEIILLPETWNLGFFPEKVDQLAEEYSTSSSVALIKDLAKKYQCSIVAGSIIINDNNKIRNRAITVNQAGQVLNSYDKAHLFSPGNEDLFFEKGTENFTFEVDGVKAAHVICYDLRFPEYLRRLALDGAELIFVSAQWPHPRVEHWQILSKARAIENQVFVITANGCGEANKLQFCGHSAIINPWGEIIEQAEEEEKLLYSIIDMDQVASARNKIPVFKDRSIKLY